MVFRSTSARANADALSHLPLPEEPTKAFKVPELMPELVPELVLLAEHLNESPVTSKCGYSHT